MCKESSLSVSDKDTAGKSRGILEAVFSAGRNGLEVEIYTKAQEEMIRVIEKTCEKEVFVKENAFFNEVKELVFLNSALLTDKIFRKG